MTPEDLKNYLENMRMSHVYQPVMIKRMLMNGGNASAEEIAIDLVQNDQSQIEYYIIRVNTMVGKVLRQNGVVEKEKSNYRLLVDGKISERAKEELIMLCDQRIKEYVEKRGMDIWDHRRRNRSPIDGSVRYQVLNRAHNRCELCGVSAEERALEVDHIVPKNWAGEDSMENYQALCYKCNAGKRDTDDTDFRNRGLIFEERSENCIFCQMDRPPILQNELAFAILDKYPVTYGHTLIIPKRHFDSYFDITQPELNAIQQLLLRRRLEILESDAEVEGFNIGINQSRTAGQTIMHLHVHLIPRRKGDVEDPMGGIRHVIPGKGRYGE
jgi:diadenosine tetraphosphate (Ap4A) HIT family hydrolase/5-methylcytosine-specific restriction endonuclease McrA